jgi:putative SOS response-associated peptidase YedK
MCGRYTLAHATEEIIERFAIDGVFDEDDILMTDKRRGADEPQEPFVFLEPSYNIAPTTFVPVVRAQTTDGGQYVRGIERMRWGLIPFWNKNLEITKLKPLINSRVETLAEKAQKSGRFTRHRCLISADGFYEWQVEGKKKRPLAIGLPSRSLFAMAGIWDEWTSPDGSTIRSCSIITVPNNQFLHGVHHRMPAILEPGQEEKWIDIEIEDAGAILQLLRPYNHEMDMYEVSTLVNSVANNSSALITPIAIGADAPAPPVKTTRRDEPADPDAPVQMKLL